MIPEISVIVPVFKTKQYLRECLQSLANQTLKNIEIILVCDGEQKEKKICLEFVENYPNFILIENINKRVGGARNAGLKVARGAYIGFVDSDDFIDKETYELALNAIKSYDVDFISWGAEIFCEEDLKNTKIVQENIAYHTIKQTGLIKINTDSIMNTSVTVWNKLFKANIVKCYHIEFTENSQFEDNEFFYKYCAFSDYAYFFDKYLYKYRQRKNSLMQNLTSKTDIYFDWIKVFENIYNFYVKHKLVKKNKELLSNLLTYVISCYNKVENQNLYYEKLLYLIQKIDNRNLKNIYVEYIKQNKIYLIESQQTIMKEYGNKLLGISLKGRKLVVKILGIKLAINLSPKTTEYLDDIL